MEAKKGLDNEPKDKATQEPAGQQPAKQEVKVEQAMTEQQVNASLDAVLSAEQKEEFLSKYVGEGKKYKSVEDLAKSYAHAEVFIKTLKQEKEELEKELENLRESAKLIKNFQEVQAEANANPLDIDAKVREALERQKQTEREMQNKLKFKELLLAKVNDEQKAVDLINGFVNRDPVNKEVFNKLIARDPESALRLIGLSADASQVNSGQAKMNTTLSDNSKSSVGNSGAIPLTWSEAQKIRKENPQKYKSHAFQQLLHKSALIAEKEGIDFFKT